MGSLLQATWQWLQRVVVGHMVVQLVLWLLLLLVCVLAAVWLLFSYGR